MKQARRIRVLIADDHQVVREGLAAMLNRQPDLEVIAAASDGASAVELFCRDLPDLALIDLRMPGLSGLDAIQAIRQRNPEARLVVLTTFEGDEEIYRALRAGARGYLLKDASLEELLDCIRAVHAGGSWLPPKVAAKLANRLTSSDLSRRELEVLNLMVGGKSNKEIGEILQITEGTVKVHVNHILDKLGVNGRTAASIAAVERGIVHPS